MFFPVEEWFPSFALTVIVEAVVVVAGLRRTGFGLPRLAATSVFANLATHPVVWFVITQLLLVGTPAYILVAESWAIAAEAACYWIVVPAITARRALAVSFLANLASFGAGIAVSALTSAVVPLPT